MPSIKYLGPTSGDDDVVNRLRLQTEISGTLSPAAVDQQITTSLAPKADATYLSNKASQYVTPSVLTGKGATLVPRDSLNNANGPARIYWGQLSDLSQLPNQYYRPGGKGWNKKGEWNSGNLSITSGVYSSTNEQQIGSFTVDGPSFPWIPIFMGFFTIGYGKGEICIKQGTRYLARAVSGNDPNAWFTCDLSPTSPTTYTGNQTFTLTRRAFFSPGSTNVSTYFHFCCMAVPG